MNLCRSNMMGTPLGKPMETLHRVNTLETPWGQADDSNLVNSRKSSLEMCSISHLQEFHVIHAPQIKGFGLVKRHLIWRLLHKIMMIYFA